MHLFLLTKYFGKYNVSVNKFYAKILNSNASKKLSLWVDDFKYQREDKI